MRGRYARLDAALSQSETAVEADWATLDSAIDSAYRERRPRTLAACSPGVRGGREAWETLGGLDGDAALISPEWRRPAQKDVAANRVRFLTAEVPEPRSVRDTILASWRRSLEMQVAADKIEMRFEPDIHLDTRLARSALPGAAESRASSSRASRSASS